MPLGSWSLLRQGDAGDTVSTLQYLLRAHGYIVAADGDFGPETDAAVRGFQTSRGLIADGVVGTHTWTALIILVEPGSSGDAVRAVQVLGLVNFPDVPPLAVDGVFGSETEKRVREFQGLWGLTADGVVGEETWFYLVSRDQDIWPLVKRGSVDEDSVRAVQHLLRAHGSTIAADGEFGLQTENAVMAFQTTNRLAADGIVDSRTWPVLVIEVGPGSEGEAVRAAQSLLRTIPVDGIFGPETETAVREFQGMWGLTVDGIVGPRTWQTFVLPKFD